MLQLLQKIVWGFFKKSKQNCHMIQQFHLPIYTPQKLKLGSQWGICTLMLNAITDSIDMGLGGLRKLVMDREAWLLRFMWLQRVGHDWATKLNRPVHGSIIYKKICIQILMLKFNNCAFFFPVLLFLSHFYVYVTLKSGALLLLWTVSIMPRA